MLISSSSMTSPPPWVSVSPSSPASEMMSVMSASWLSSMLRSRGGGGGLGDKLAISPAVNSSRAGLLTPLSGEDTPPDDVELPAELEDVDEALSVLLDRDVVEDDDEDTLDLDLDCVLFLPLELDLGRDGSGDGEREVLRLRPALRRRRFSFSGMLKIFFGF